MIYETEAGGFVISSHQAWMPGVYADRRAANYAFRFLDETLGALMENAIQENRLITFEDLQDAKRKQQEPVE